MFRKKHSRFLSDRSYLRSVRARAIQPIGWTIAFAGLIVLCAVGDFANVNQTVESLLGGRAEAWLITVISVFGTAVAVAIPPLFARVARDRHEGVPSRPVAWLIVLGAAWTAVVAGVTYVRIVYEVGSPTRTTQGGLAGTQADLTINGGGMALTIFMTALLVATGALGIVLGWLTHDPRADVYKRSAAEWANCKRDLMSLNRDLPQFEQALAEAQLEPEREQRRYRASLDRIDAIAGRYRELVREAIAKRLNDPAVTSAVLLPLDDAGHDTADPDTAGDTADAPTMA